MLAAESLRCLSRGVAPPTLSQGGPWSEGMPSRKRRKGKRWIWSCWVHLYSFADMEFETVEKAEVR
jgi:hypothetical protein